MELGGVSQQRDKAETRGQGRGVAATTENSLSLTGSKLLVPGVQGRTSVSRKEWGWRLKAKSEIKAEEQNKGTVHCCLCSGLPENA